MCAAFRRQDVPSLQLAALAASLMALLEGEAASSSALEILDKERQLQLPSALLERGCSALAHTGRGHGQHQSPLQPWLTKVSHHCPRLKPGLRASGVFKFCVLRGILVSADVPGALEFARIFKSVSYVFFYK